MLQFSRKLWQLWPLCTVPETVSTVTAACSASLSTNSRAVLRTSSFPPYRRIGAVEAADLLDRAVRLFPFDAPHLHRRKGSLGLRECGSRKNHEIWRLSDELIENPDAWAKLKAYVEANREVFPAV